MGRYNNTKVPTEADSYEEDEFVDIADEFSTDEEMESVYFGHSFEFEDDNEVQNSSSETHDQDVEEANYDQDKEEKTAETASSQETDGKKFGSIFEYVRQHQPETLQKCRKEDQNPPNESNTIASDVNSSGIPIENDPDSEYVGQPAPVGTPETFGIPEFFQGWDAMCGRFTIDNDCSAACPFFRKNLEENCFISQFPKTDNLLTECGAIIQKYMQDETKNQSRRIDVMKQIIPGFKEEYLSDAGKCTALDHVDSDVNKKKTWLEVLQNALPDLSEQEFSEAGLAALSKEAPK